MDTRPAPPDNIGPRNTPIGSGETYKINVWRAQGNSNIPTGALGVIMNVTVVNPTGTSYLTVWPADKTRPLASKLNWTPHQPSTPHQVTSALAVDGTLDFYNNTGTVDVIVDIVGYLADHNHDDRNVQRSAFGPLGLIG